MTLQEKLTWCQRACDGREIDVLLGKDDYEAFTGVREIVTIDLASANHQWRHDRTKLQKAIENLLG